VSQTQAPAGFPSTHWSIVAAAVASDTPASAGALAELLRRYRSPLVAHVCFRFHTSSDEAEDLVHSFIEQKVLQRELLHRANPRRGKFRTFLLESLDNFVRDQFRRQNRQKRKAETIPLEELTG
jgi:RNA polymerase sigma-70 factor (ECF subfamily)